MFAQLYDEAGTPGRRARLPVVFSQEILSVLEKFAHQQCRIDSLKDQYFSTQHWNETLAQEDKTIRRDTQFPHKAEQWILSGPHFYVGNPFNKTPRRVCTANGHYDPLDLELLPDDYLPRTNYVPACDPVNYRSRTPSVPWDGTPVTEFYSLASRTMIGPSAERTLISHIMPKQLGHLDLVFSLSFKDLELLLKTSALFISVPYDFFIKSTGKSHFRNDLASLLAIPNFCLDNSLIVRSLMLNCLTSQYDDLWAESWDLDFYNDEWTKTDLRLNRTKFTNLTPKWNRNCALRTDFERRQALVEIDVLASIALGLTCDELCVIYRIQFPVLRQNEDDTWYDQNGRIVFTCSKGLPGVGVDRSQWEKESNLDKLTAFGLRIDGINPSDFSTIKDMPHGTVTRTVTDDTIADYRFAYGTFRKDGVEYHCPCPDLSEPIEGPVERDITYVAPFTKCDREEDYRTAWKHFEERLSAEERQSQALPRETHEKAEIRS